MLFFTVYGKKICIIKQKNFDVKYIFIVANKQMNKQTNNKNVQQAANIVKINISSERNIKKNMF